MDTLPPRLTEKPTILTKIQLLEKMINRDVMIIVMSLATESFVLGVSEGQNKQNSIH